MKLVVRPARRAAAAIAVAVACGGVSIGSVAFAHDEIESSIPAQDEQVDEPISSVYLDFGQPVEGIELSLAGPDDVNLPGDVVVLSESEARFDFEPLTEEGEYVVQYLAEEDGHLVFAAFSFTYGDPPGSGAGVSVWVLFGVLAALILGIGAFFSFRRGPSDDTATDETTPDSEADDALPV